MKNRWSDYFGVFKQFFKFLGNKQARKSRRLLAAFLMTVASLYVFFPADILPDVVPVLGYFEDGTVFIGALALIKMIMEGEGQWIEEKQQPSKSSAEEEIIDVEYTNE